MFNIPLKDFLKGQDRAYHVCLQLWKTAAPITGHILPQRRRRDQALRLTAVSRSSRRVTIARGSTAPGF